MKIYDIKGPVDGEKSREWFKNYCQEIDRETMIMSEISDSDNYIKWLERFCKKYKVFYADTWSENTDHIDSDDLDMVGKIDCLYGLIRRYADANYILGDDREGVGIVYYFRYNNTVYQVGLVVSGAIFYCKRLDVAEIDDDMVIIEFDDVKNIKNAGMSSILKEKLTQLSNYILELKCCGVSDESIKVTVAEALKLKKHK